MADRIERSSYYLAQRGRGTCQSQTDMSRPYDWTDSTIRDILSKPEYMGHTVNFRSYKPSYKDKKMIKRPPEEWLIFDNIHEAIVDEDTWKLAQRSRQTVRRTDTTGKSNPLTGLLFCADCGAKMYNHKRGKQNYKSGRVRDPETGLYPGDYYNCSTYDLTSPRLEHRCSSHYISTKIVRELVLDTIQRVSAYAAADKERFVEKVRANSQIHQENAAKETERKLARDRERSAELDGIMKMLYESYAVGRITEKRFDILSGEYEREQEELDAAIAQEKAELDTFKADTDRTEQFLKLVDKYTDFSELTDSMICEFIDKILVHKTKIVDGERVRQVDIYLRFVGKIDIPAPEPTAEELAERERLRRAREKQREYSRRHREKKLLAAKNLNGA